MPLWRERIALELKCIAWGDASNVFSLCLPGCSVFVSLAGARSQTDCCPVSSPISNSPAPAMLPEKGKHSLLNGFLRKPREKEEKPQERGDANAASTIVSKTSSSHSTLQVADPAPTPSESLLKVVKDSFHASSLERENHFQSQLEYHNQIFQAAEWERNQDEESRNVVFRQFGVDVQRDWSTRLQEIAKDLDTWQLQSHDASLKQQASRDQIFHNGVETREKLYKDGFQRRALDLKESEEKRIQAYTRASEKLKMIRLEVRRTMEVKFNLFLAEERQKYEEDEKRRNNIVKRKTSMMSILQQTPLCQLQ
ncbi:hypothetical protein C8Q75DRAFT_360915 [Abortiporus biennis]|nr:hypothetical protein C8Q75DRAFT_360915 [Abortiporus biennis]